MPKVPGRTLLEGGLAGVGVEEVGFTQQGHPDGGAVQPPQQPPRPLLHPRVGHRFPQLLDVLHVTVRGHHAVVDAGVVGCLALAGEEEVLLRGHADGVGADAHEHVIDVQRGVQGEGGVEDALGDVPRDHVAGPGGVVRVGQPRVHLQGHVVLAVLAADGRRPSVDLPHPEVHHAPAAGVLQVPHQVGHVYEDVVVRSHEEAGVRAAAVHPVELQQKLQGQVVEGVQEVLLDEILVQQVLLDQLLLKASLAPPAPRWLLLGGSQGKQHLDGGSQLALDVGLVAPGGSDGVPPPDVLWGGFDKEEEEDVLACAFVRLVQQVGEGAEDPGLLAGDGEAPVDVGEAVDQVAVGVGFDVTADAVVQLLPADHHDRDHQAGGQQLHALVSTHAAEHQNHP